MQAFNYELKGGEELKALWRQAPQVVQEELVSGMEESLGFLWHEVVDATPRDTGLLAGSILPSPVEIGIEQVSGTIGTPVSYAIPVEIGTGPHVIRAKNGGALHFMWHGAEITVKSVNHPGTKPVRMFAGTMERTAPDVEQIFAQARARIVARLGGTA